MNLLDTFDSENMKNIFYYIYNNKGTKLEWLKETDINTLDYEYYLQHSGDKNISILFKRMLELKEGNYANTYTELAKMIISKYADNWDKMYDAVYAEYNPIENYNGVEDYTDKTNINLTNNSKQKNYGINSGLGKDTASNESNTQASEDDNYTTHHMEKHGNLGMTTSQQMIESELVLREFIKNFYNLIYNDIDSILASSLYN